MTQTNRATAWTVLIAAIASLGSYGFACVFPFAALATIAALTLPLPRALALTASVWAANQAVGYLLLSYPHGFDSYAWGSAIGGAALLATCVASLVARAATLVPVRAFVALAAAFVVYEAALFLVALRLGGLETFVPHIVAGIGLNDLGWFLLLAGLRLALDRLPSARDKAFVPA